MRFSTIRTADGLFHRVLGSKMSSPNKKSAILVADFVPALMSCIRIGNYILSIYDIIGKLRSALFKGYRPRSDWMLRCRCGCRSVFSQFCLYKKAAGRFLFVFEQNLFVRSFVGPKTYLEVLSASVVLSGIVRQGGCCFLICYI